MCRFVRRPPSKMQPRAGITGNRFFVAAAQRREPRPWQRQAAYGRWGVLFWPRHGGEAPAMGGMRYSPPPAVRFQAASGSEGGKERGMEVFPRRRPPIYDLVCGSRDFR